MGYDTTLEVDGRVVAMWRKHASHIPRLLFRHDQLIIEVGVGWRGRTKVAFQATAGQIQENLEVSGLGWHATVAAYSRIRVNAFAAGLVMSEAWGYGESPRDSFEDDVDGFKSLPAVEDLEALSLVFSWQWKKPKPDSDGIPKIFERIKFDEPLDAYGDLLMDLYATAKEVPDVNGAAAVRAMESWIALNYDAPLLAWPMLICLLLRHLDSDTSVVFDLTDDADAHDAHSVEEAKEYANSYWLNASTNLSNFAETLGHLFSVLASFDSRLGKQFWFARAADLMGQLEKVNDPASSVSTKARGDALEALVEAIMRIEEPQLQIIEKNFRTREEEIDLLLANSLSDPFWAGLDSPLIMVECKNWRESNRPGVGELRVLESKMGDRRSICKIGIFISVSGFSDTFMTRLKSIQSDGGMIFAVTGEDLSKIISEKVRLTDWLKVDGLRQSLRG